MFYIRTVFDLHSSLQLIRIPIVVKQTVDAGFTIHNNAFDVVLYFSFLKFYRQKHGRKYSRYVFNIE